MKINKTQRYYQTNNPFNVISIIFSYSLSTNRKISVTLKNKLISQLGSFLLKNSLENLDAGVGGLLYGLFENVPHSVV